MSSKIIFLKNGKDIDEDLMANAMKYLKNKTKKEIINTALSNYVQQQIQLKILSLQGKVKWIGDLDKMRRNGKLCCKQLSLD